MGGSYRGLSVEVVDGLRATEERFIWVVRLKLDPGSADSIAVAVHDAARRPVDATVSYRLGYPASGMTGAFEMYLSVETPLALSTVIMDFFIDDERRRAGRITLARRDQKALADRYYRRIRNADADPRYPDWFTAHRADEDELARQRASVFSDAPLFSIVTPVYNTPEDFLRDALDSVLRQSYGNWEHVLVNASPGNEMLAAVLEEYCERDGRFRVLTLDANHGIAANTNEGIAIARGDYVSFLDHDDILEPNALYEYAQSIAADPETDLLYCDEDSVDAGGAHPQNVLLKPGYNPDLLYSNDYVLHFLTVSRFALEHTLRSDSRYDGAQDYDLTLKTCEVARSIHHVPKVLYHWRMHENSMNLNADNKSFAQEAGRRVIADYLAGRGLGASVSLAEIPSSYRTIFDLPSPAPKVSLLMPVIGDRACPYALEQRGGGEGTAVAIPSGNSLCETLDVLLGTDVTVPFEIVLSCSEQVDSELRNRLRTRAANEPRLRLVEAAGACDEVSLVMRARESAQGDLLFIAPMDMMPVTPDYLDVMAGYFARPETGAVTPRMSRRDGLLVGMGADVRPDGALGLPNRDLPAWDPGFIFFAHRPRDVQAALASCLMIRADVFDGIGGLPDYPLLDFAAADLCLEMSRRGFLTVYTPFAEIVHDHRLRGAGREASTPDAERYRRACDRLRRSRDESPSPADRGRNPNLDPYSDYFELRFDGTAGE